MRYGSTLAILVLRAGAPRGMTGKADLLRMQLRTALFGGGGTLALVTALWFAILHDLSSCS